MKKNQNALTKERVLEVYADIREKMLAIGAPVCADVTLEYMPKSLKMRMGDCKRRQNFVSDSILSFCQDSCRKRHFAKRWRMSLCTHSPSAKIMENDSNFGVRD